MVDQKYQRPMFAEGNKDIPENWIMNSYKNHGKTLVRNGCDYVPLLERKDPIELECSCIHCLSVKHPGLVVGDPVTIHPSYTVEKLKEMNRVGLYVPEREEND